VKPHLSYSPLLLIYGEGGHRREMQLLLQNLAQAYATQPNNGLLQVISIGVGRFELPAHCQLIVHFEASDVRDKVNRWRSVLRFIPANARLFLQTLQAYQLGPLAGVISTGPGIAVLPTLILRCLGIKSTFVETYCRFDTRSLTGRVMSKLAHRFLVQNKSQLALYSKAEYCGRL